MERTKKISTRKTIVERNLSLVGSLMQYLIANPHLFDALPDQFELVVLPEDEPEIRLHNLELLDAFSKDNKPIVFARIVSSRHAIFETIAPNFYVPIAA